MNLLISRITQSTPDLDAPLNPNYI